MISGNAEAFWKSNKEKSILSEATFNYDFQDFVRVTYSQGS
jgi:hypothetical protein